MSKLHKILSAALAACIVMGAPYLLGCKAKNGAPDFNPPAETADSERTAEAMMTNTPEPAPTETPEVTPEPTAVPTETPVPSPTPSPTPMPPFLAYRSPNDERELRVFLAEEAEDEALAIVTGCELTEIFELSEGSAPDVSASCHKDYRFFAEGAEYGYCSGNGALVEVAGGLGASLKGAERQRLNTLLGVGAVRGSSIKEGYGFSRAAIARLDTTGENASVSIEFYNDTEDWFYITNSFLLFYMKNGRAQLVGTVGDPMESIYYPPGAIMRDFDLSAFDLSRKGLYRICFCAEEIADDPAPSDCWLEFEVGLGDPEPPELGEDEHTLRGKYPYYFDLDTTEGLDVYVWQIVENSYSCAILPGSEAGLTWEEKFRAIELRDHPSLNIETAKQILACYGLPEDRIRVIPYRNTLSSHFYVIDALYTARLRAMFFGGE